VQYLAARLLAHVPDRIKIRLSGEPPIVVDGQQLDPQLQLLRAAVRGRRLPGLVEPTVAAGRGRYRRQTAAFRGPVTAVADVRDLDVPGAAGPLPARLYSPVPGGRAQPDGWNGRPVPLMVYLHGGGFTIGDLDTHDEPCRILCRYASMPILSVAYRLAPEHPFPAALDDVCAVFAWARDHSASMGAAAGRAVLGGDSAGGNLAAVAAVMLRADAAPLAQLLIYPATDFASRRRSQDLFGSGFYITRADMDAFRDCYLSAAGMPVDDPRASPLRFFDDASSPLENRSGGCDAIAPALVVIAGFDPLRDDGDAYARALEQAGTRVRGLRFPHLGHGFIHMTGVAPAARHAMIAIAHAWKALIAEPGANREV
jgi:acetyl esterase